MIFRRVPSPKLTVRTWKWMVGIQSFPFGKAYFQELAVSFRAPIPNQPLEAPDHHPSEQVQLVNLRTPRVAPFDEGLILASGVTCRGWMVGCTCHFWRWAFFAPPHLHPTSSYHQLCVFWHVENRKSHWASWNWLRGYGSKRRNTIDSKKICKQKTIGSWTGIGKELCKESGCSTSWLPLKFRCLMAFWSTHVQFRLLAI